MLRGAVFVGVGCCVFVGLLFSAFAFPLFIATTHTAILYITLTCACAFLLWVAGLRTVGLAVATGAVLFALWGFLFVRNLGEPIL